MKHDNRTRLSGEVIHVFAHRFVVRADDGGAQLADLGPKGAQAVTLKVGDRVALEGEAKPSEIHVQSIAVGGGEPVRIDRPSPKKPGPHKAHEGPHEAADPAPARATAEAEGFRVVGEVRRKPKHFEVLGRDEAGGWAELHIELDGRLRKSRPLEPNDPKWRDEFDAAR